MRRLIDQLPRRRQQPLARTRTYIARRLGAFDPAQELRRQRALLRAGR